MDDIFSPGSSRMETNDEDDIKAIHIPYQSGVVVLLSHPAELTLYKYVSVTVISGSVSINGYEMNKKSKTIKVFSSEKTNLIKLKTENSESMWRKTAKSNKIELFLKSLFNSGKTSDEIIRKFDSSTVAIHIQRCVLPNNVEFVEFYYPDAFEFNLCKKSAKLECYFLLKSKKPPLQFDAEDENIAKKVNDLIKQAKLTGNDNPKVLVYGPRNSGKSTLLSYFINRILSEHGCAYYLDTDPGQPEFTPPGVVSLTEIRHPVLGPPFFHQKRASEMMFVGDISPNFLNLYKNNVLNLMKLYTANHTNAPLFVNTMGWMEGIGLQVLESTLAAVKPTVLVEIVARGEDSMFDYREHFPSNYPYYRINSKHEHKLAFSPKEMRELSLLSHLGKCQPPWLRVSPINDIQPYCVPWNKIPLFVFPGGNILPSRIPEAMNQSIVALCSVPETFIIKSNIPEFPATLDPESDNKCLAYGLVTAVDEVEQMLYIVSPLKEDEYRNVNAILKGTIMTPDSLILKQEIYNVPLPFTNIITKSPPDDEEMEESMVSLKYLSENQTESTTVNPNAFSSLANYRKPVGKRYREKYSKTFLRKK